MGRRTSPHTEREEAMNHRKAFTFVIAVIAVLLPVLVHGDQTDKYTKPHEPFTAYGMQVRMSLVNPINNHWKSNLLPTVFQEIAPCRLSSTLENDHYDVPWGGPAFLPNQTRFYRSRDILETATFVDPCSTVIPTEAIGLVVRFHVTSHDGDGELHVDPREPDNPNATLVLKFKKGETLMFEAGVMLTPAGTFGVSTWYAGADITIDVLGYLLPDPAPMGAKGDQGDVGPAGPKGDKGDAGPAGAIGTKGDTGATGAKGDKGDTGATGAKGDTGATGVKGDKGDAGATGAKGDKGDVGPTGATGAKGDTGATGAKGDKGDIGATGAKGDKGDVGPIGATGAKGDKGDVGPAGPAGAKGETGAIGPKGDTGDQGPIGPAGATGPQGEKGDTGAIGPMGPKGDIGATGPAGAKGDTGATGPKGDKGDVGPTGETGAMGPMGPQGPRGPRGPASLTGVKGNGCYPPGNNAESQLTVHDSAVTPSSIVILNYTDAGSNGNALAIISQGVGSFQTTGSPNKCFQYAVFNASTEP